MSLLLLFAVGSVCSLALWVVLIGAKVRRGGRLRRGMISAKVQRRPVNRGASMLAYRARALQAFHQQEAAQREVQAK